MVQIIRQLQNANYTQEEYQIIRENLVDHVVGDIQAMSTERVEVRLEARYVEQYKARQQYECLDDMNKEEIIERADTVQSVGKPDVPAARNTFCRFSPST